MSAILIAYGAGPLLDPDCAAGEHAGCPGPPCACDCHHPARPAPDRQPRSARKRAVIEAFLGGT